MAFLLDTVLMAISVTFLSILGIITGLAIPALFIVAAAPWLDRLLPIRHRED